MRESRLLEEGGRAHFLTRRFDRENGEKPHLQFLDEIVETVSRWPEFAREAGVPNARAGDRRTAPVEGVSGPSVVTIQGQSGQSFIKREWLWCGDTQLVELPVRRI